MNNQPESMDSFRREAIVTACPDCGAFVQLPPRISTDSIVQCPSCGDQYPVRAILPESIPELIVVRPLGNGQAAGATAETEKAEPEQIMLGKLVVPDILRNGARRKSRSRGRHAGAGKSRSDGSGGTGGASSKKSSRSRNRESHSWAEVGKRDSGPKNPVVEGLKLVAGGLLALPVAQFIIWWLIGLDPLNLAPSVGRAVPFIVPASLRAADEEQKPRGTALKNDTASATEKN